jgi:uncharacterized membrane protein
MHAGNNDAQPNIPPRAPGEVVGAAATVNARQAVKAKHIVTVDRPRRNAYDVARRWVSNLPDVELVSDTPGEVIAWKTRRDSRVAHAGSVNVHDRPDRGTEVRIEIDYEPPGVSFGARFDELTNQLISGD